jgi:hypothetical protein
MNEPRVRRGVFFAITAGNQKMNSSRSDFCNITAGFKKTYLSRKTNDCNYGWNLKTENKP